MRSFIVVPGKPHTWTGMPEAAGTVTEFLANVRVTGDVAAAEQLLAAAVPAHQHIAERDETVFRTPRSTPPTCRTCCSGTARSP